MPLNRYLLIATLLAIGTGTALAVYGNNATAAIFAGGVCLLFVAGFRAVGLGGGSSRERWLRCAWRTVGGIIIPVAVKNAPTGSHKWSKPWSNVSSVTRNDPQIGGHS